MSKFTSVNDSGDRHEFSTGSVRDRREGKGLPHLIPPMCLLRLAQHFENGAVKYGARNWEKGQPYSSYLDSAQRHLWKIIDGANDEDHFSAAIWNIMALMQTKEWVSKGELPKELNDMDWSDE